MNRRGTGLLVVQVLVADAACPVIIKINMALCFRHDTACAAFKHGMRLPEFVIDVKHRTVHEAIFDYIMKRGIY